ncbi:alpha/beta hydrolase [Burkholderia multivorans]|uniref:Alpha/beta hydrolase n=1 Tax=Burkholderia multivorans TaxID=87883 RepID=A0A2S9MS78_9BURK|nr:MULTISPECIES: gamma-mobile-trio protein GmtX [Burkholderia cepacia complex]MBR7897313.1 alpha/beta hydrolase [Burkholderia multivorans]MBR8046848.1 alpha/beta hydrolase [Burkholderia multivorans]MBU9142145.1 alpha/beta hydrolase [Burkholderia multivorans]MBU9439246.1 alpha/beta hydrolase [Burkholderia multivorans]MBU9515151.1 alpha/beta hydrolase [Burkholderia multivorans]
MNVTTEIHPDSVVEAILATSRHPTKRRNLELIHQVCVERHRLGSRDFSLKAIGEAVEARGGLKVKALWNPQSADYRKLIEAWQAFAGGPPRLRELEKVNPADALTRTIPDPATRIIVEKLIRDRNALRAEVNILKSQTTLTIDRRPLPATKSSQTTTDGGITVEVPSGPTLNKLEREALEHAVSKELWDNEGWSEEKHGRVVRAAGPNGLSRTIFKPGFLTAIRRILGSNG